MAEDQVIACSSSTYHAREDNKTDTSSPIAAADSRQIINGNPGGEGSNILNFDPSNPERMYSDDSDENQENKDPMNEGESLVDKNIIDRFRQINLNEPKKDEHRPTLSQPNPNGEHPSSILPFSPSEAEELSHHFQQFSLDRENTASSEGAYRRHHRSRLVSSRSSRLRERSRSPSRRDDDDGNNNNNNNNNDPMQQGGRRRLRDRSPLRPIRRSALRSPSTTSQTTSSPPSSKVQKSRPSKLFIRSFERLRRHTWQPNCKFCRRHAHTLDFYDGDLWAITDHSTDCGPSSLEIELALHGSLAMPNAK